ncbi:MAG: hypothetical protein ABII23_07325 [bacterium]
MKKLLAIIVLVGLSSPWVFGVPQDPPVFIRGIRPLGMGGAFTALADDQNAVFYNPAALTQREGSLLTAFEFPITVSEDFLEFYDFIDSEQDNLEKFDELTAAKQTELIREINNDISKLSNRLVLGPQVNYLSGGQGLFNWGVGLYTKFDAQFRLRMDMVTPSLDIATYGDVVFIVPLAKGWNDVTVPYFPGRSFTIPGKLSVGANYKRILRTSIVESRFDVTLMDSYEPLPQFGDGWELDIASLYELNRKWAFGLTITDITRNKIKYGYVSEMQTANDGTVSLTEKQSYVSSIPAEVNVGVAFRPQRFYYFPGKYLDSGDRLTLLADVRDVLSAEEKVTEETFWAKLHLGAEYSWFLFQFRGGLNQGYPTIGLGVSLLALKIDYAFFTDELGRFAGQRPQSNHMVSIALRFGGSKGRAREQARNNQEIIKQAKLDIQ